MNPVLLDTSNKHGSELRQVFANNPSSRLTNLVHKTWEIWRELWPSCWSKMRCWWWQSQGPPVRRCRVVVTKRLVPRLKTHSQERRGDRSTQPYIEIMKSVFQKFSEISICCTYFVDRSMRSFKIRKWKKAACRNLEVTSSCPGNIAWAFATLSIRDLPLLDVIAKEAIQRITHFNVQGMANTAWALAKARFIGITRWDKKDIMIPMHRKTQGDVGEILFSLSFSLMLFRIDTLWLRHPV